MINTCLDGDKYTVPLAREAAPQIESAAEERAVEIHSGAGTLNKHFTHSEAATVEVPGFAARYRCNK
ncbi:hypothetical protein [Paenibacillus sp. NAIST15-1]|uniref:hypothetical protein n=1 Tax=Paenibacillus sp. NAIST15-1 TaxID=1605994 RepID=UPI00086E4DC6|nr:hypothetical protein [Paenibacillus sp. NAIST15-1]GAV10111.1 hypothetical protein PBN151_0014 [Paenibacillus sp. NAIST15-1]